jgi:hypothetical protein
LRGAVERLLAERFGCGLTPNVLDRPDGVIESLHSEAKVLLGHLQRVAALWHGKGGPVTGLDVLDLFRPAVCGGALLLGRGFAPQA